MSRRMLALTLGALMGVSACSGGYEVEQVSIGKNIRDSVKARVAGPAAVPSDAQIAAGIAQLLHSTTGPVLLAQLPSRDAISALVPIETNQGVVTWATAERQTLSTRSGMLVATRGLGEDIMSVDVSQSLALVTARKAGGTQRVQRYLDGEIRTQAREMNCAVSRGETEVIKGPSMSSRVTVMTEICVSGDLQFSNTYKVDGRGNIIQSKQWISPINGSITLQRLR